MLKLEPCNCEQALKAEKLLEDIRVFTENEIFKRRPRLVISLIKQTITNYQKERGGE